MCVFLHLYKKITYNVITSSKNFQWVSKLLDRVVMKIWHTCPISHSNAGYTYMWSKLYTTYQLEKSIFIKRQIFCLYKIILFDVNYSLIKNNSLGKCRQDKSITFTSDTSVVCSSLHNCEHVWNV